MVAANEKDIFPTLQSKETQRAITCSESTLETTPKKVWKMFKVNNKENQNNVTMLSNCSSNFFVRLFPRSYGIRVGWNESGFELWQCKFVFSREFILTDILGPTVIDFVWESRYISCLRLRKMQNWIGNQFW